VSSEHCFYVEFIERTVGYIFNSVGSLVEIESAKIRDRKGKDGMEKVGNPPLSCMSNNIDTN